MVNRFRCPHSIKYFNEQTQKYLDLCVEINKLNKEIEYLRNCRKAEMYIRCEYHPVSDEDFMQCTTVPIEVPPRVKTIYLYVLYIQNTLLVYDHC